MIRFINEPPGDILLLFKREGGIPFAVYADKSPEYTVLSHADTIYRVAFHYLKKKEDAEDIVHDVFIKWMENPPSFADESHEKAWFIRVTINACKDVLRSAWRRKTVGIDSCTDRSAPQEFSLLNEVKAMPPEDSTVIYLHYYEGYRVQEIARILHKNPLAVQSRLYRARQKLKRRLEDTDEKV